MRLLILVGLFTAASAGIGIAQQLAADQRIIVPHGKPAPGGGTFGGANEPVIGQGRHIAFQCRVGDLPHERNTVVFVGLPGELQRLLGKGNPVPGGPEGMTFKLNFTTLWVGPDGEVTVSTDAEYKEAPKFTSPRCLVAGVPKEMHQLAVQGLPIPDAPEGMVFDSINATANNGITAWSAVPQRIRDVTPEDDTAIMAAKQGSVITMLREGIKPQGVRDPRATLDDVGMTDFGFGGGGLFALKASLSDVDEAGTNNLLLGVRPGKREEVLLRSLDKAPAAGWVFDNFNHPRPDDGGAVLSRAIIRVIEPRRKAQGFFHRDTGGKVRRIMVSGDPAPGTDGKSFKDDFGYAQGWLSPRNGFALLQAPLDGVEREHTRGLWLWSEKSGQLQQVAQAGMAAPGVPGATFRKFSGMAVNSKGQVVFGAELENSPGRNGIWAGRPGKLTLIALDKGTIAVAEGRFEMGRPVIAGRQHVAGQGGPLNDSGQLVYVADLREFGKTVLLAEVPE